MTAPDRQGLGCAVPLLTSCESQPGSRRTRRAMSSLPFWSFNLEQPHPMSLRGHCGQPWPEEDTETDCPLRAAVGGTHKVEPVMIPFHNIFIVIINAGVCYLKLTNVACSVINTKAF